MSKTNQKIQSLTPKYSLLANQQKTEDITASISALVADAIASRASDMHLNPWSDHYRILFRIDGALHPAGEVARESGNALIRAIQVAAEMDIATSPARTEGAASLGEDQVSCRIASASTVQGEKLTIRFLDPKPSQLELTDLGMRTADEEQLRKWVINGHGMGLITGQTGAGKTTTAYALIAEMQQTNKNIVTLEDPVESVYDGLTQIPVADENPGSPATFADGIRDALRHDIDALFIGEIRDHLTARAAVNASFSGHVVLGTMHAHDPAGAISLLRSMGAKDYELAASLGFVVSQRIVRLLCAACKAPAEPDAATHAWLEDCNVSIDKPMSPVGCSECSQTGFRGRTAVFECWRLSESDYELLLDHADENSLRDSYQRQGVPNILHSALELVRSGRTSLSEAALVQIQNPLNL